MLGEPRFSHRLARVPKHQIEELAILGRKPIRLLGFDPLRKARIGTEIALDVRALALDEVLGKLPPLSLGPEMPVELVASCVGLEPGDVITRAHRPVSASVGNSFVIAEVSGEALTRSVPDLARFRAAAQIYTAMGPNRLALYLYAHDGARIRTRMFSPLSGTIEDPATGSAATPLAALLLSFTGDSERRYEIVQGVEMGRPSRLRCLAQRTSDGIRAKVGGGCVPVLDGTISL